MYLHAYGFQYYAYRHNDERLQEMENMIASLLYNYLHISRRICPRRKDIYETEMFAFL